MFVEIPTDLMSPALRSVGAQVLGIQVLESRKTLLYAIVLEENVALRINLEKLDSGSRGFDDPGCTLRVRRIRSPAAAGFDQSGDPSPKQFVTCLCHVSPGSGRS